MADRDRLAKKTRTRTDSLSRPSAGRVSLRMVASILSVNTSNPAGNRGPSVDGQRGRAGEMPGGAGNGGADFLKMAAPIAVECLRFCGQGFERRKEKPCQNRSSKSGRRYDREFKKNAVALVRSGRSQSDVARDLGVSNWSLGDWVEQARAGQALSEPKTLDAETAEQRELRRLRARNSSM